MNRKKKPAPRGQNKRKRNQKVQCRFCCEPCESNGVLAKNRDFLEKVSSVIGKWIDIENNKDHHVCEVCQQTVEEFYQYRDFTCKVIKEEITLMDECYVEEVAFTETVEVVDDPELAIFREDGVIDDNQSPKKKRQKQRKTANVYSTRHIKTPEEIAMTPQEYRKHFKKMYGDRYRTQCEICGQSVPTIRIDGHLNRHNGLEPYTCEQCGEKFHCKLNLRSHISRNHVQGEEKECEICGKMQKSLKAYKQHMYGVHTEKKFQCSVCGLKIRSKSELTRHMDMHNQKRDFQCDHCGKAFYAKSVLTLHLRTHTGETPYICPCERGFVHRILYVKHMKAAHPGEPLMRIDGVKAWKAAQRNRKQM